MVGVDADFILLEVEGVLAGLDGAQLVVAVQVGPSPQAAVDDMRQTFAVRHLQTPVQRSDPSVHRERAREMEERSVPNEQRKTCMDGGKRGDGEIRQHVITTTETQASSIRIQTSVSIATTTEY